MAGLLGNTGMMPAPSLLVLRADADARIGSGHVMRCLALAQEWRQQGGEAVFIGRISAESLQHRIVDEGCGLKLLPASHPAPDDLSAVRAYLAENRSQPGWLVLDGYHFDLSYHDAIRCAGWSLMVIDDYAHLPEYHADILLNQNLYAGELIYNTQQGAQHLLGARYALLRREFQEARKQHRDIGGDGRRVLVTMGGADPDNVTGRVVDALLRMNVSGLAVKIVIGPLNPHRSDLEARLQRAGFQVEVLTAVEKMATLMQWADLAVTAAGSTCWELAALGVPMVVTIVADNQERLASAIAAYEAAENLGWFYGWMPAQAADIIARLLAQAERRRIMAMKGTELTDGRGCERIVDLLLSGREGKYERTA